MFGCAQSELSWFLLQFVFVVYELTTGQVELGQSSPTEGPSSSGTAANNTRLNFQHVAQKPRSDWLHHRPRSRRTLRQSLWGWRGGRTVDDDRKAATSQEAGRPFFYIPAFLKRCFFILLTCNYCKGIVKTSSQHAQNRYSHHSSPRQSVLMNLLLKGKKEKLSFWRTRMIVMVCCFPVKTENIPRTNEKLLVTTWGFLNRFVLFK